MRIEQPAKYTLELRSDGWFNIRTDCGEGEGMYETRNQRIVMAVVELSAMITVLWPALYTMLTSPVMPECTKVESPITATTG